jgi:hypothetical protein
MVEDAALVELYLNDEGQETYRLTDEGVRVGNMLALVEGEDAGAVLEALLSDLARSARARSVRRAHGRTRRVRHHRERERSLHSGGADADGR